MNENYVFKSYFPLRFISLLCVHVCTCVHIHNGGYMPATVERSENNFVELVPFLCLFCLFSIDFINWVPQYFCSVSYFCCYILIPCFLDSASFRVVSFLSLFPPSYIFPGVYVHVSVCSLSGWWGAGVRWVSASLSWQRGWLCLSYLLCALGTCTARPVVLLIFMKVQVQMRGEDQLVTMVTAKAS